LKKALRFDSGDVSGVIEDLDVLLQDFRQRMQDAVEQYLDAGPGGGADEQLERLVFGRFLDPEARKAFFEAFKEIEALWEILSPSPELRDHIEPYKRLSQLYAAVRNAYADRVGLAADLAHKTERLIQESAIQEGLGRLTKTVTFDVRTLESLRKERGPDEGKVFNLVRGLNKEATDHPDDAAVLQPLRDRAERILKDLEDRKTTGLAAMDELAGLAAEKEAAIKSARESGLSARAFGVFWSLRDDSALKAAGIDPMAFASEADRQLARFPNAAVNPEERRRLRAALYPSVLKLATDDCARVVGLTMAHLLPEENA
jgi:type I restriction enzyme R subunit